MKNKISKFIVVGITFCLIVAAAIIYKQEFIRTLPLLISLFIVLFQAEGNRYAYIAGAINSLVYTYVFIKIGILASAASSALFSFPIQILTFLNWNKNKYKSSTLFKKLTAKQIVAISVLFVVCWIGSNLVFTKSISPYSVVDNTLAITGIVCTILIMLAYVDYVYVSIANNLLNLILNYTIFRDDPSHITYVIYAVYGMWTPILAFMNITKLYKQQQTEKQNQQKIQSA